MTDKEFNNLAQGIGCKARVETKITNSKRYGRRVNVKYYEWRGGVTSDGHEVIWPVDAQRFVVLTEKYPQLDPTR